jgi:AGZA family xanthine/uracil permease-like MFS transporter
MAEENTGVLGGGAAASSQVMADVNAGLAFFLDVVVNMFVLAGVLMGVFNFPAEVIFGKIIPGAVAGILAGNLAFNWLTRKTTKETGNEALTSIPLGLDLPTTFGMAFFIVGPSYAGAVEAMGTLDAAQHAWVIGMAATLWMAVIKFILSFFGRAMQHELPQMALIGAMAGIATVWLGAEAIYGVFELPEVGVLALVIMAFALIAGHRLPLNMPGAVIAIVMGTLIYYILALAGAGDGYVIRETPGLAPALPMPTHLGLVGMFGDVTSYIGIIIPFALLIAASAVNVVAGAKVIGDEYNPSTVVKLDAAATAVGALFGGVVQTTPYFGHATYKRMGGRTNYALGATGLVTFLGFVGAVEVVSMIIPSAVLKPILVVVASDIIRLSFSGGSVRHAPALLFAIVPAILNYTYTKVSGLYGMIGAKAQAALSADWLAGYALLGALSRGYILTSLIWAALMVWILDRRMTRAAIAALTAAVCTEFGIIHSVLASSGMYVPWNLPDLGGGEMLVHRLAAGYLIAAIMLFVFGMMKEEAQIENSS